MHTIVLLPGGATGTPLLKQQHSLNPNTPMHLPSQTHFFPTILPYLPYVPTNASFFPIKTHQFLFCCFNNPYFDNYLSCRCPSETTLVSLVLTAHRTHPTFRHPHPLL